MSNPARTQEDITRALMAVLACAGNYAAAVRELKNHGIGVAQTTLKTWATETHLAEFERLRDEYAPQMEAQIAHEFRNVAALAVEVQMLALTKAKKRLVSGEDTDPGRTASFAARSGQVAVDKLMSLTNRPQKIVEQRTLEEVLRSLQAKKVLVALPAGNGQAAIEGEAKEEGDAEAERE